MTDAKCPYCEGTPERCARCNGTGIAPAEDHTIVANLLTEFLLIYDELTTSDLQSAIEAAARKAIGDNQRAARITDTVLFAIEEVRQAAQRRRS